MLKVLQSDIGLWKILTENSIIFNGHSHCRQRTRGRIMRKIDDEIRDDEVDAMLEEELIKEAAMVEKALLAKPGIQEVTPEETEAAFQRFLLKLKQSEIQDPELGVVL